jgi:hypothetical protein
VRVAVLAFALAAGAPGGLLLAGCESTQDKSARLEREGASRLAAERAVVVRRRSEDVRVIASHVVTDANGTAVVVELRNVSARPVARARVALDVAGAGGASVYRNDTPGLDPSLTEATGLAAGATLAWVNDQVTPSKPPRRVDARVGDLPAGAASSTARLPAITVEQPRLSTDAVTGVEAIGHVRNGSRVEQRRLVVFCVARKRGRVVAAGRGIVNRLAPGRRAKYHVFFIGDPRGAQLTAVAPPTVVTG